MVFFSQVRFGEIEGQLIDLEVRLGACTMFTYLCQGRSTYLLLLPTSNRSSISGVCMNMCSMHDANASEWLSVVHQNQIDSSTTFDLPIVLQAKLSYELLCF